MSTQIHISNKILLESIRSEYIYNIEIWKSRRGWKFTNYITQKLKMKKLFLLVLFCLLPLLGLAQNNQDSQKPQWWNKESNLWDLTLRFCNDKTTVWWTKALQMTAKPWEEKEVCILLNNDWPTPLKIWLNFVDGSSTSDADAKKACQPEDTKTYFGQYISAEDTWFLINPKQTIQTIVKAKFPDWYAGMAYWCTTFQVLDNSPENTGMFKVVSRRANFVDIYVDGKINVWLELTWENNSSISNISNNKNLIIYDNIVKKWIVSKINIYNSGNVWITGEIKASYKYMRIFNWTLSKNSSGEIDSQKFRIMPKLTMPYEFDTPSLEINIPWIRSTKINYMKYIWWPISIKYDINYNPEIFWPDTQSVIKDYNLIAESSAFILPRRIMLIILIILIRITYKNRKYISEKKSTNGNQ